MLVITMASTGLTGPLLAGVLVLALSAMIFKVLDLHTRLVRFYAGPPRVEDRITQLLACAAAAQYGPGWLHSLEQCRRDPVLRRVAELYFRGADSSALRSAARAQTEAWLEQRNRLVPLFRRLSGLAMGASLGGIAFGVVFALVMGAGWWSPPPAFAVLTFLTVLVALPTLGLCRAMLQDPAAHTAAGLFDREMITTAFAAIIDNADGSEVERRLRQMLPSAGAGRAAATKVA